MGEVKLRDHFLALVLMLACIAVLGLAQHDQGVMRDEATYFQAAESYWGWFDMMGQYLTKKTPVTPLSRAAITRYFQVNNEHPVLLKVLFGFSWYFLHQKPARAQAQAQKDLPGEGPLPLNAISAFRLPGWLFTGFCVALIYLFGVRIESRLTGIAAALLYITIPRVFFHGQLACFDSPITTMWLLVVYAYFRALDRARWGVLAGIIFGLALATKHNAWFIPAILLVHYLLVVWSDVSLRPLSLPRVPLALISMALLGPLVFIAHWPWLWFDTIAHIRSYFAFHLHHSYYNIEYLGQNWGLPPLPISYPFGMTLFTVSTVSLLLTITGVWIYAKPPLLTTLSRWTGVKPPPFNNPFRYPAKRSWLRPGKGLDPKIGTLLVMNGVFPLLLIALPWTPIFGGTKHWLPAYPFFALLAGVSISRLAALCKAHLPGGGYAALILPLAICIPSALNTAYTHPFGLSQYNALAGGPAGGADLGLNRQFWGYPTRQLLPWINEHVPPNGRVYFHDTNHASLTAYIRDKLLRPNIIDAGMERPAIDTSSFAIVIHELHFNKYDYWIWDTYGTGVPAKVIDLDGVPIASIYQRPEKKLPPLSPQLQVQPRQSTIKRMDVPSKKERRSVRRK